jgi:hypothetical protein
MANNSFSVIMIVTLEQSHIPWLLNKNIATKDSYVTGIEPPRLFDRKRPTKTFYRYCATMAIKRNRATMAVKQKKIQHGSLKGIQSHYG